MIIKQRINFIYLAVSFLNVFDKPRQALPYFDQAVSLFQRFLHSAMLGRVQCINDLRGPRAALSAIEEVERFFPHSVRVAELKAKYRQELDLRNRKQSASPQVGRARPAVAFFPLSSNLSMISGKGDPAVHAVKT